MSKNSFWNDASRCGAILGAVHALFACLGMCFQSMALLISLVALVAQIWLLARFTSRRSALFAREGFSYSQSLGFIVAMGIFAGIVNGAYEIIAGNFLFTETYEANLSNILAIYSQMGTFDNAALDSMSKVYRSILFSPVPVLLAQVFSLVLSYGFYGLFISIGTKREPALFESDSFTVSEMSDDESHDDGQTSETDRK